jgi:hypothetical protein
MLRSYLSCHSHSSAILSLTPSHGTRDHMKMLQIPTKYHYASHSCEKIMSLFRFLVHTTNLHDLFTNCQCTSVSTAEHKAASKNTASKNNHDSTLELIIHGRLTVNNQDFVQKKGFEKTEAVLEKQWPH